MKLVYFLSRAVTNRWTSASMRVFSASVVVAAPEADWVGGGTYHLERRVLPCRFCNKKKRIYCLRLIRGQTGVLLRSEIATDQLSGGVGRWGEWKRGKQMSNTFDSIRRRQEEWQERQERKTAAPTMLKDEGQGCVATADGSGRAGTKLVVVSPPGPFCIGGKNSLGLMDQLDCDSPTPNLVPTY